MLRLHTAASSCTQHVMLRYHAAASSCTQHVMLRYHAAASSCTQHVVLRLHAAASSCTQLPPKDQWPTWQPGQPSAEKACLSVLLAQFAAIAQPSNSS